MTQEELNKLILGNFTEELLEGASCSLDEHRESLKRAKEKEAAETPNTSNFDIDHYRVDAEAPWPPPPPIDDHKLVHQLDDVTKSLELKGVQVFDQIETISANADSIQKSSKKIKQNLESQKELFVKLTRQFPNIAAFKDALKVCEETLKQTSKVNDYAQEVADCSLQAMDIMQYQDIHRQKIERVVNVMRTLAKYLNSMFETDIEDDKRVTSATYLEGDTKDDVVSSDEIESLIKTMGKK